MARAREQFTKAHELHPELPDAAAEMITVSMADRSDEERLWFDRSDAALRPAGRLRGLHRAMNGYLKLAKQPAAVQVWKSRLALLHWATGRYAEAAAILDDLGDELAPRGLTEFRATRDDVIGECRLFGGRHADAVEAAEEWLAERKFDEAQAAYEKVAKHDAIPAGGRRLLASRIAAVKTAAALERDEWVDLQPAPDLAGWRVLSGDWKVEPDGTLVGVSPIKGSCKLVCEADLGEDIEFTLECDLGGRQGREAVLDRFRIMAGHDDAERRSVTVMVGGSARTVWLTNGFNNEQFEAVRVQTKSPSTLRVILWDGKATVFLNDKKIVDKVKLPEEWLGKGGLAVSDNSPGPPLQMRMRKLRARRLEKAPADF